MGKDKEINEMFNYKITSLEQTSKNKKPVVHRTLVNGISFPLVIADSEQDITGIEPEPLGWHTSTLTNELHEVRIRTK